KRDARSAARDLLQEQGDDLLHHPRPRGGDLPRSSRRHHDHAALQAQKDAPCGHPASTRLQRPDREAFSRADGRDQRRRTRGSAQGLSGRRERGMTMIAARLTKIVTARSLRRGVVAVVAFLIVWELGSRSNQWMAPEFFAPFK